MTANIELLVKAVEANPSDETTVLVLADAMTEEGGKYEDNVELAKLVALKAAIDAFVEHVRTKIRSRLYRIDTRYMRKWCKIVVDTGNQIMTYGFVCLKSGCTRKLGKVTPGDIHIAASWAGPARHARGNVLNPGKGKDPFPCAKTYGIAYLR